MFHFLSSVKKQDLPQKFTNPFCYKPHSLCERATEEVMAYLCSQKMWQEELRQGKMFGVLVVENGQGEIGFLAAFSGTLMGKNILPYFVPPVYDFLQKDEFFREGEACLNALTEQITAKETSEELSTIRKLLLTEKSKKEMELAAYKIYRKEQKLRREALRKTTVDETILQNLIKESQFEKAEQKRKERRFDKKIAQLVAEENTLVAEISNLRKKRKNLSVGLQQEIFRRFSFLNAKGEEKNLLDIFKENPPSGAGECAAPKLLQCAYKNHLRPIAMAEFWYGETNDALRRHGYFYPACKSKCEPILGHMLQGLDVEKTASATEKELEILYEDDAIFVVNKPEGMLSVKGKIEHRSAQEILEEKSSVFTVHRLDMHTSGILVFAKTKESHKNLQAQFVAQTVTKKYIALLNGILLSDSGKIELPLCLNIEDRPRQMVNFTYGKPAVTLWRALKKVESQTLVEFMPITGRTHQLRVHAAHQKGLNAPIVGDRLYGKPSSRLFLHAESISFLHPTTGKKVSFTVKCPFA